MPTSLRLLLHAMVVCFSLPTATFAHADNSNVRFIRERLSSSTDSLGSLERDVLRAVLETAYTTPVLTSNANADDAAAMLTPGGSFPSPVVFIHIPKTGGRHFRELLRGVFGDPDPAMVHGPVVQQWRARGNAVKVDSPWYYVHFDSSVVSSLLAELRRRGKSPRVVTFLRDPVERVVSEFYAYAGKDPVSLADFVDDAKVRNRQVRFLAGVGGQRSRQEVG